MSRPISLCYHPTTVIFIDDNHDFISSIRLKVRNTSYCKFYIDPLKALDFLKKEYQSEPFIQRCFIEPEDERSDHLFYSIDLRKIHQEIQIAKRFEEVSVIVIDYTMPKMNGLELSKAIRALYPTIHILLLTGEADHDLAVEAFNEGIIDKFIKKNTPDLGKVLNQSIKELEHQYFIKLSQAVFDKVTGVEKLRCCGPLSKSTWTAFIRTNWTRLSDSQNSVWTGLIDAEK